MAAELDPERPRVDFEHPAAREYFGMWLDQHAKALRIVGEGVRGLAAAARASDDARPLAVVLDIDEVLLCGIVRAAEPAADGFHPAMAFEPPGCTWPRDLTPGLPGTIAFLRGLRAAGVQPLFVSGRREPQRARTADEFAAAGFTTGENAALQPEDLADPLGVLRLRPEADDFATAAAFKTSQRARLAKQYRLLASVGDQVSDLGAHVDRNFLIPNYFYVRL